jgi:hypothetical protein
MSRRKVERETPDFAKAVKRMIRAQGRRVAAEDPENLAYLLELREAVNAAIDEAVAGQYAFGFSWTEIGRGLGITRQAARQMYGAHAREQVSA